MQIKLEWLPAHTLGTKRTVVGQIDNFDLEAIPSRAGVYVFARKFGRALEPIYIGKALNLRTRLKSQFNSHKLMRSLADGKSGDRVLMVVVLKGARGLRTADALRTAERAHIEHALTSGNALMNIQLTRGPLDSIERIGKATRNNPFPKVMLVKPTRK